MGNPNSKNSLQKPSSLNNTVNFINSSGDLDASHLDNHKDSDVFAKFTWNYGGNQVLLTGSFYNWKKSTPLQKQGDQFSITIQLPKGVHQYKFIVDGQWRFSPEDPSIPDNNGNINNYIDTTNFHPLIEKSKNKPEDHGNREDLTDRETSFQGVQEFAKNAPKLPPHYEACSYLKSSSYNPNMSFPNKGEEEFKMQDESKKFEQGLTQSQIMQLFDSPHSLAPPYHVEVDHLICQKGKNHNCFCITQRFKNKYTTYRYYMSLNSQ